MLTTSESGDTRYRKDGTKEAGTLAIEKMVQKERGHSL